MKGWPQTNFADEKCRMWLKISAFSADFAVRFCVRNQEYTISFCGCTIWKSNYILCGRVLLTSVYCVKIENSSYLAFKSLHPHQSISSALSFFHNTKFIFLLLFTVSIYTFFKNANIDVYSLLYMTMLKSLINIIWIKYHQKLRLQFE